MDAILAHRIRMLDGLRAFGANYAEFTQRFAASLGVHSTDAAALVEIMYAEDRDVPLSPARLGERIGLTSGATTSLINRLEKAGHVTRTREHADRRIVTLHTSPEIRPPAIAFFATLGEHLDAMLVQYPDEQLHQIEGFLDHLKSTMANALDGKKPQ